MNTGDYDERSFDELLASPALVADHGFTGSIHLRIQQARTIRKVVFAAAGIFWLLIASVFGSWKTVLDVYEGVHSTAGLLGGWFATVQSSAIHAASPEALVSPLNVSLVAAVLLCVTVGLAMQLQD